MRLSRFLKFLIVVAGFMSVFSVYSYVRIIKPYFNVGVKTRPTSPSVFFRQTYYLNGERYSYWTNGVENPRKILVMLPPSVATGDYFGPFAVSLPKDVLIIAPDYPGRGLSSSIEEFDTAPLLAGKVAELLKELLGVNQFTVVAPSFGGMVAANLAKRDDLNIEKIILIATGEFFAPDQKSLFHFVFYPATLSEKARLAYANLLNKEKQFENIKYSNLKDLLEQWMMTLGYQIDTTVPSHIPTILVKFTYDNIVQEQSYAKYGMVFRDLTVYEFPFEHTGRSFFDERILSLIEANI